MRTNAFAAALFVAWVLPGLIGHDPWKPDEAYSFGLVLSALREPSVIPVLAGEPFVEKPPLYYFTAAAFARILSPPLALHDAARLASAFFLAVAALFVWLTARALFRESVARLAVILLLGCVGLLIRAHQLITDTALLAGFAIGIYGLARSAARPLGGGFWLGTGTGIGFMAKGLLAPGVLGISALLVPLIARGWRRRGYAVALVIAFMALMPWLSVWPLALFNVSPTLFSEWFWDNNFGRFLGTSQLGPKAQHGHYLKILPWYTLPVLPLALLALWRAHKSEGVTDGARLLLLVFLVTLGVLSASADARELYALPLLLPLAVLAAAAADALPPRVAAAWHRINIVFFGVVIAAAWIAWLALDHGISAPLQRALLKVAPSYEPGVRWLPLLIALVYTAGWLVLARRLTSDIPERPAISWSLGLTVTWALAMTLYIGWLDSSKSYRAVSASLTAALPATYDCISSRGLGEPQRAMFDYYAGLITYREEKPARRKRCDLLLVQHSANDEVSQRDVLWRGARAGDDNERFVLYRVMP